MEFWKTLADNKIFSRFTASSTILSGMGMMWYYMTSASVNAEVLAVAGMMIGSAGTFLFMSEKS